MRSDSKYQASTAHFQRHWVHPVSFYEPARHKTQHCASLSVSWQVNCQPAFDLGPEPVQHVYLFTFVWHSTEGSAAGVWPVADTTGTFQSSSVHSDSPLYHPSHTSHSLLWIGVLEALDMVNWTFYGLWKGFFLVIIIIIALFYSWVSV